MKRAGNLMQAVADPENLRLGFHKACRGKRVKPSVRAYQQRLDVHLPRLRSDLLSGQVTVGSYHYFTIHEPKERTICAASFGERVLHHALMNVCEPVFERVAVPDSYACRKGKGRLAAIERASEFARRQGWFLKMDIRRYFASVDHAVLEGQLARKFKDAAVLRLFGQIIASYQSSPGKGLPIGNLTSQYFANFHLGAVDRFIKERLRCRAYVRYMDDFVVWGDSPEELAAIGRAIGEFLDGELKLVFKAQPVLNRTAHGMDFLGYRLYPTRVRLSRRSKVRFRRKLQAYEGNFLAGDWTEEHLQRRVTPLLAFVQAAASEDFRRVTLRRLGRWADGLQPRESRGQLGQRRGQPALCQPQQQRADGSRQQHRLPVRPSSACPPEGHGLTRPTSRPSHPATGLANSSEPPGASRASENSGRLPHQGME